MDEDTDLLLVLLVSSLPQDVSFTQETLLDALVTCNGDVERATRHLMQRALSAPSTVPQTPAIEQKRSNKRKAPGDLSGWLKTSRPRLSDSEAVSSAFEASASSSSASSREASGQTHTQRSVTPISTTTALVPLEAPPPPLLNFLKDGSPRRSATKQTLPVLMLSTPEMISKHTPTTLHASILPVELACRLYYELIEQSQTWSRNEWYLNDRLVESPHTTAFFARNPAESGSQAMEEASRYWYNGRKTGPPRAFTPTLEEALHHVESVVRKEMLKRKRFPLEWAGGEWSANVCAANCYRGSKEGVGAHADHLTYLGPYPTIASISLGTTRTFRLREVIPVGERETRQAQTFDIPLPHNSLLIMHPPTQEKFKHSIPTVKSIDAYRPPLPAYPGGEIQSHTERINITFSAGRASTVIERPSAFLSKRRRPGEGAMATLFQSLTSLFAPARRDSSRAGSSRQTLSYTHDAFTLPTHSPTTSNLEPSASTARGGPSAFRYPPATPGTANDDAFSPVSSSMMLNHRSSSQAAGDSSSILPMYQPRSASSHPPLDQTWERIKTWFSNEYPECGDTLNWGILPEALAEIELSMGMQLPRAVRESYLIVDGQEAESSAGCSEGLFFGLTFLPLEEVLDEWRFWREVDDDPTTGANPNIREQMQSIPDGWIRREYSCRGWIPLITDKAGNYIGVDVSPPPRPLSSDGSAGLGGSPGQVIIFGRDYDSKIVLWRGDGEYGWARWLASFAEELEAGEGFEVRGSDHENDGSDAESEDSVGYESYFFAGAGGSKGGDAGSHGSMRFTGEYKGWNAIEVWADRSYKRWYAAGLIPDEEIEEPVAGPSGQSSTAVESATQPPLIATDVPAAQDSLDSATPTELVAAPNRATSIPPPAATTLPTTSNTVTTMSSTNSQAPLLPPPSSSTATAPSEDLLSLRSPDASSWSVSDSAKPAPGAASSDLVSIDSPASPSPADAAAPGEGSSAIGQTPEKTSSDTPTAADS